MFRRIANIAFVVLVFAGAFALKNSRQKNGVVPSDTAGVETPLETPTAPLPRLVDLGANKCIPCKKMAPILEEITEEYRGSLRVDFIDVWKDPSAGKSWGIRVIPTQIFIDAKGVERFRHEGFMPKQAILQKWKELEVDLVPRSLEARS